MRWIGISGSWRKTNAQVEHDVRAAVQGVFKNGDGIVTGGAIGVDYIATEEMLRFDPSGKRVLIILPTSFKNYLAHYEKAWQTHATSEELAKGLIRQLENIYKLNPVAIREMEHLTATQESYYLRNSEVVKVADELLAFHVNNSQGTQDTIDKARAKGIPVKVLSYTIE